MPWMDTSPVYHWSSYHQSTPSVDKTALKQKSCQHLSNIPCLKPLHWRLQPYQLPRHHPPDHLNSHILQQSETYQNWKIIQDKSSKITSNQTSPFPAMNLRPSRIHIKCNTKPVALYLSQYTRKRSSRNY